MTARRFPPPWSVEEQEACFVVRDPQRYVLIRAVPMSAFEKKADIDRPKRNTNFGEST
jgi:hypothetical protein